MSIKIEFVNVCRGCLSSDRNIKPMKNNTSLFFFLLEDSIIPKESNYFNMHLCWECMALLKKVAEFQKQIQRSKDIFIQELENKKPCLSLSRLSVHHKNNYDEIIEHKEIEPEPTIKLELFNRNNVIKTEANDSYCDKRDLLDVDFTVSVTEVTEQFNKKAIKEETSDSFYDEKDSFDNITEADVISNSIDKKEKKLQKKRKSFKSAINTKRVDYNEADSEAYMSCLQLTVKEIESLSRSKRGVIHDMSYRANVAVKKMLSNRTKDIKMCSSNTTCTECTEVLPNRTSMIQHWNDHTIPMYKCYFCVYYGTDKDEIMNHLQQKHPTIYICNCEAQFRSIRDYFKHNKNLHTVYDCDICKKRFKSRATIEKHMLRNHLPSKCNICHKSYRTYNILKTHKYAYHSEFMRESEKPYCVECDMRFKNDFLYKRHLRSAVAHRPRREEKVPCPDCGKIFTRKTYMMNHYKLVHVRQSKHYCDICDKYFITGYAIRTHKKFVHDKLEKPKDKICEICGRGFFTNRVLINHKRTHTGERPFTCSYCPAAFAQRSAMKTHERTQHKNFSTIVLN
ncbi:zinc finger protein 879-like [Melitaea cinxia]|uniref:zinc finger protein 879-like n=1 Tax=Melitaea cinxia TaxID=113334 RepID=UPI001E2747F3|nr:zinc finger protein 879-like [Melitaea cinxia]